MLGKINMANILTWWLPFYLVTSGIAWAQEPCHPSCSWQCDNPICPAICDTVCEEALCQNESCDTPDCQCTSFGMLQTIFCGPLANDCPLCTVAREGIDCLDGQGQVCSCTASCQTKDCKQVCHKPACPKPTCELVCENALCPI
jgi:hypothetical protein